MRLAPFFDVEKLLRFTEKESKVDELEFELDQLRIDNAELQTGLTREQKCAAIYSALYMRALGADLRQEVGTQTEVIDHYFIFSTLLRLVIEDDPDLKNYVLTETKYTDLFWKFFEFQELIKSEISSLPKMRANKSNDTGKVVAGSEELK